MELDKVIVITSINSIDSPGVVKLIEFLEGNSLHAIVVADRKTPIWESHPNIDFLTLEMQQDLWPKLSRKLPLNHYSRKNLGYLRAAKIGVLQILDTDDDNCPESNPWKKTFNSFRMNETRDWVNIYRYFGEMELWPRGLPLNFVNEVILSPKTFLETFEVSCFQSIVDGDPDIDAIGRLLFPKQVQFANEPPIVLGPGVCPTNSQATIWMSWVLPMLYLPSTVTFRMTDIWRGLIAQPAILELGGNTVFGKLGFRQVRNEHDLIRDFESEVSGHLHSEEVLEISQTIWTAGGFNRQLESIASGMKRIYEKLVARELVEYREIEILDEWFLALESA